MKRITPEGTATQICEWIGVPDPSIKPVMHILRERGLEQTSYGVPPRYNTAQAFDLYHGLGHQLPPDAAKYREMTLEQLRVAAEREADARAKQADRERVAAEREADARAKQADRRRFNQAHR